MSWLDLLFPARCLVCQRHTDQTDYLCADCRAAIPLNQTLFCASCGARLPENRAVCHPHEPYLLGAATNYRAPGVKTLIHGLKFKSLRGAAAPLADLVTRYVVELNFSLAGYTVLPIPLGRGRERVRGFNQALLLAEPIAKHFGLPLALNILRRIRETKPQSELRGLAERRTNLAGSFEIIPGIILPPKIVLVDDVATSGITLHTAAETLKQAGVRKIIALTAARV